ncbi:60S ribosomal protein L18 [Culex quinquefasciatus]|uniref:60S ribosomal protein L18 n=1 Tax=Culex quinquefasciatus TaxID=7176 RepID=UPI0018E3679C|nr:60S ribosomal protein L18 [Culex quinquefasciatus]
MDVCALRVMDKARERILKWGGKIYTFDQLALLAPTGKNTVFIQAARTAREAITHFGLLGCKAECSPRWTHEMFNPKQVMAADGSREIVYSYEWVECIDELIHAFNGCTDIPIALQVIAANFCYRRERKTPW